jgi:hypothetical protein
MLSDSLRRRHVALFTLAGVAIVAVLALIVFRPHSAAATLPPPFQAAQPALSDVYGIEMAAQASSTAGVVVTRQQAIDNALRHMSRPLNAAADAALVTFTDTHYTNPSSTGSARVPVLANHVAWLVLIPDVEVPIERPYKPGAPAAPNSYSATLAVFIDAHTGGFLEAVTVTS